MKKNKDRLFKNYYKGTPNFKIKIVLVMKKLLLLAVILSNALFANSTTNQKQTSANLLKQVTTQNFSQREIPLDQYTTLKRVKESIDKKGDGHVKYQSTCNDLPIENHFLIAHKKGDKISWSNRAIPNLNIDPNPTLQEQEAFQIAFAAANVNYPIWEISAYENLKKQTENDQQATNKPNGELVIYDGNYSYKAAQYRLTYKFEIFSVNPLSHKIIYVDAHTGIVLGNKENTHNCSETCNAKEVTGPTNYIGEMGFEVCCDDNGCYLESDKGGKIIIYDAKESWDSPQNCIINDNDNFDDPTANEVFYATNMYYDFLLEVFERKSIDDEDHAMIAYVHYGEKHNNAYWWRGAAYFGDGDGEYANSYTSVDIVAHEYTHGLNDYTANLIYEGESGALDESFADIFGILLEHYLFGETDWQIGNDFMIQYNAMRDFANPTASTLKNKYPTTYKGNNWKAITSNCGSDNDNCGVHTNSSVQNHWFYLLSEGSSGVNDNGYAYNVEGIGIENAAKIVYENLTNYLFPTASFADAREGAIQAAIDIFGEDSFEAEQTALAWCAVGVGACGFKPTCDRLTDSLALVAFYNSTNGDNWDINVQWDFTKPMDTWQGVTLNENGCVKKLSIYWSNLTGTIPPEIGNLSSLEELTLAETPIGGEIPKEIEQLTNLKKLTLVNLELTGSIPAEIGNLTQLESLTIKFNNLLSGPIPNEIGQLNNLKVLELNGIDLSGEIPNEIFSMINLEVLILGGLSSINQEFGLTGSISKKIGNLINLKTLSLSSNQLTGTIPDEIGNLLQLESLGLWWNNLEGSIPKTIGRLKNLESINLSWNKLTESIPIEIAQLDSLRSLALDHNKLTGTIPLELCELENLTILILSFNQLTGCYSECFSQICNQLEKIDDFGISDGNNFDATFENFCASNIGICTECNIDDWTALKALYESTDGDNWKNRTGWDVIIANRNSPPADCNLGDLYGVTLDEYGRVSCIDLDGNPTNCNWENDGGNNLNGPIPAEISLLKYLKTLRLQDNNLSGPIPSQIGDLNNLTDLNLVRCGLIGSIPPEIGDMKNLIWLNLGGNDLTGSIPPELGKLTNLRQLFLYYNSLTGIIPSELGGLTKLVDFSLGDNDLTGSIPPELGNLLQLRTFGLDHNELSGVIPLELGNLIQLTRLTLNDNQLTGIIPVSFAQLENLERLFLHNNNLSGCFAPELKVLCSIDFDYEDDWPVYGHSIDKGNNFDISWEEFCTSGAGECIPVCNDRQTLIEIYNALGGPDSDLNWDFTQPIDTWKGVTVNEYDCVTQLNLNDKNLNGFISPSIGNLKNLSVLNLSANSIFGEIPAEIGNLTKLKQILLNDNGLSGEIPPSIGNLVLLEKLWLYSNQLTGSIPAEIGNLTLLKRINIEKNQLTGSIPPEIGNLKELTGLVLASNMLTGEIPIEIGNLTKLGWLQINRNELNGEIPASIGYLSQLTHVYLEDNLLTGGIPAELCNLSKLEVIRSNHNQLSGCYPECLQIFCDIDAVVLGSGFNATWEDFCATGAGICIDTFVLPGDFNNDACLSYLDVLFWGLAEGNTGLSRTMPTNNFVPQNAEDWEVIVNGVDGKHQDANGDGIVNIDDLYVFIDNYVSEENRCDKNEGSRNNDYLNFARIEKQKTVEINETISEVTYAVYIDSKVDNMKVGIHGLELEINFIGRDVKKVDLDVSNFEAEVDTVTSLEGASYRFAATRTDKGLSIFGRDKPAAILVVTVEDLPGGAIREKEEIILQGSIIETGAGIEGLSALQGATTFIVTDNEVDENSYTVDIVTSPGKGEVKVFVNLKNDVFEYTYEQTPGAEPCESIFREEKIGCNEIEISDGCGFSEIIQTDICNDDGTLPINNLQLYPSLVNDKFTVISSTAYCGIPIEKIAIYDSAGNVVQPTQTNKIGTCGYRLNVGEFASGIYFINMFTKNEILRSKFMKL